jgi:hypothetical protein
MNVTRKTKYQVQVEISHGRMYVTVRRYIKHYTIDNKTTIVPLHFQQQ